MAKLLAALLVSAALGCAAHSSERPRDRWRPPVDAPSWLRVGPGAQVVDGKRELRGIGVASGMRGPAQRTLDALERARLELADVLAAYGRELLQAASAEPPSWGPGEFDALHGTALEFLGKRDGTTWMDVGRNEYLLLAVDPAEWATRLASLPKIDPTARERIAAQAAPVFDRLAQRPR